MEKKFSLVAIVIVLIVSVAFTLVACGEKNNDKPTPIQMTEDMTKENILELLPQIENLTYEFECGDPQYHYTYQMKLSKNGYVLKYIYDKSESIAVYYFSDETETIIEYSGANWHKVVRPIENEQADTLNSYVDYIKECLENNYEWRVEDGKLIIVDPNGNQPMNGEITFKNFNCTDMEFKYYLSLDIEC
ncbi:MAG: hypothetical protein NC037_01900 [Bacteroides sp.]|nr:hypothetical protein [Bacillota bacterium]MCM1394308.1 hypothetical protein [[Eubacterium] siraeum]MCM1455268.1 hypothetical protein [Bacteroides sp.]